MAEPPANRDAFCLHEIVPMLRCGDVPVSVRWICDVLGFDVVDQMDVVGASGWACLRRDGARNKLASPTYLPEPTKTDGKHLQCLDNFHLSGVVTLHAHAAAAGAVPSDLRVTFYGKQEFNLSDPDGHQLLFGEDTEEPATVRE